MDDFIVEYEDALCYKKSSTFFTYKDALKWVSLQKENHNLYKWEILDFNTGAILDKGTVIDYD